MIRHMKPMLNKRFYLLVCHDKSLLIRRMFDTCLYGYLLVYLNYIGYLIQNFMIYVFTLILVIAIFKFYYYIGLDVRRFLLGNKAHTSSFPFSEF